MKLQRFNWQIWAGFLLSLAALVSYPFVFVRFPVTRDFPWANLLLFGIAAALLLLGVRRAWTRQKPDPGVPDGAAPLGWDGEGGRTFAKIVASVLATLSVAILGFFIFAAFIISRWLPASQGAPQIGQKAPDFSLADTNGRLVSLSELLSAPINGETGNAGALARNEREARTVPKGVLLVFYRGSW
jgi:hypothetical protein